MNSFSDAIGGYAAELHAAVDRAGWIATLLLLPGWFACPFVVQSMLHPLDVVKLTYVLHGLPLPHTAAARQLIVALSECAMVLAVIGLWQLVVTVAFYRRAQIFGRRVATPRLWPVAALLVGGIGNLGWFIGLGGETEFSGYVIGLTATAVTIGIEMLSEKLGRDFVVGPPTGFHPPT
jgi:hypothetical protein